MKNISPIIYTDANFSQQLKKFRFYRGYKTQAILCKMINVSRQVWSLWELNKRKPTLPQLIEIANCLEVDISYFFLSDAAPEDYDLTIDPVKVKIEKTLSRESINKFLLMPFVETVSSRQIFRSLDQCRIKKGVYVMNVLPDSGSTRAIQEYYKQNPDSVSILEGNNFPVNAIQDNLKTALIVIDDADKLANDIITEIISLFIRKPPGSIVFLGKKINKILKKIDLEDRIHEQFVIDCITTQDFDNIAKAALPAACEPVLNFLRIETGVRLNKLFEIIRKIDQQQKNNTQFSLTINTLLNLCNQI